MAEQQRRKEEREARIKAEAQQVMNAGMAQPAPAAEKPAADTVQPERPAPDRTLEKRPETEPVHVIDFRVHATMAQLDALKEFLKKNGIRYEPVPKQ